MKSFRFRLQPVLRWRESRLEQHRSEAAQAEASQATACDAEQRARVDLETAGLDASRQLARGVAAGDARSSSGGLDAKRRTLRAAGTRREQMQQRLAQARERAVDAWREVRALELLRSRAREQHRVAVGRREQRELDEVAARSRGIR